MLLRAVRTVAPWLSALAVGLASLGCTTSLATLTPAQTTPGGHVRIAAAAEANAPVGDLLKDIQAAQKTVEGIEEGTIPATEDVALVSETAVAVVATPPTATADLQFRAGLSDEFDLGVRFVGGTVHGDVRYQFLGSTEDEDTFFGSVGVGGGIFVFGADLPVPAEYEGVLTIENNAQYQLDASVLFGASGTFGHFWLGPKVAYSGFDTDTVITLGDLPAQGFNVTGNNLYYGGQVGFALGFKFIWVMFELTVAGVSSDATAAPKDDANVVGSLERSSSGLLLYPAGGLLLEF